MGGGDGKSRRLFWFSCAVVLGTAMAKGLGAVGTTLRLVDWLVIFASGFGAGALLAAATATLRGARARANSVSANQPDR